MEIARTISKKIQPVKAIEKVNVSGPYLNFFISPAYLAEKTLLEMKKCLSEEDIPKPSPNCEYCAYVNSVNNAIK